MFRLLIILALCSASLVTSATKLLAQSLLSTVAELAPAADTIRVLNADAPQPLLLISNDTEKKISLFRLVKGVANKIAEGVSLGHVWEATLLGDSSSGSVIVAYGLGRGDLNAPLRVVSYPLTLDTPTEIRVFPTERAQTNFLKASGDKVTITYFISKYDTETGTLARSPDKKWSYEKLHSLRMGTSTDIRSDLLTIGRMYGDKQQQDGDVLIKQGSSTPIKLPSYRGVSSVAFYPTSKGEKPNILIGDGWHSNYGQLAEGRLSVLVPVPGTPRYALDLLHTFESSYAVTRIFPTGESTDAPVLLATNNHIYLARPGATWQFTDLYTQKNTDKVFDIQYAGSSNSEIYVLVSDGSATLYKVARGS